jgi:hypothetical protein
VKTLSAVAKSSFNLDENVIVGSICWMGRGGEGSQTVLSLGEAVESDVKVGVEVELELSGESLLEEQAPLRRYTVLAVFTPGFTVGERKLSTIRRIRIKK